jgi:NADH-quinone oxidoreductase subunit J
MTLFYFFGAVAVLASLLVIAQRNPIYSVLLLIASFGALSGLYVLLEAPFVAVVQIIVYAGAIMVLIVFVVMLLNLGEENYPERGGVIQRRLAPLLSLAFAAALAIVLWRMGAAQLPSPSAEFGTVEALGRELFTRFFYPFEVISLLLVAAMIGAVLLAKRRL